MLTAPVPVSKHVSLCRHAGARMQLQCRQRRAIVRESGPAEQHAARRLGLWRLRGLGLWRR